MHQDDGQFREFLTFTVDDTEYAVDIKKVREIKGWSATTKLPNSPPFMAGVINLRGMMVPIFDLRARLDIGQTTDNKRSVFVMVDACDKLAGVWVDAVSNILNVETHSVKPAPELNSSIEEGLISGLISHNDQMIVVLNVDGLINDEILLQAKG